jgi:hypothetical protein
MMKSSALILLVWFVPVGSQQIRTQARNELAFSAGAGSLQANPDGGASPAWSLSYRFHIRPHRRRFRTSNLLERLKKEIKRRTRVATLFPNEAALLQLVSAVLMEISEEWKTEKIYLRMKAMA